VFNPQAARDRDTFISLAIECGLASYVRAKLDSGTTKISDKKGRPLLAYAVLPRTIVESRDRKTDFRYEFNEFIGTKQASPVLVEALLRHGADPNDLDVGSVSIWQGALMSHPTRGNLTQSGDILKLLMAYGADPFAGVEEGGRTRSALFAISLAYRDDPTMQTELTTALQAKGAMFFEGEREELSCLSRGTTFWFQPLAAVG
jgi:hypothetical protein